jgi:CRP-like cAMP-binding protein
MQFLIVSFHKPTIKFKMLELLSETINKLCTIEPKYIQMLVDNAKPFRHKKGAIIVEEGVLDTKLRFITKGLMKSFHETTTSRGNKREANSWFFAEGDIVINLLSSNMSLPADETLQALEDCEGIYIGKDILEALSEQFPSICKLISRWTSHYLVKYHFRLKMLRHQNANQRMAYFETHQNKLAGRLPRTVIAAYLDIDTATLSRIKFELTSC